MTRTMGMHLNTENVSQISSLLVDRISHCIFANRVLYGLTDDDTYIRSVIATTEEGEKLEAILAEHQGERKVIFGAGNYGKSLYKFYNSGSQFVAFVDNAIANVGKQICGLPVISLEEYKRNYSDCCIFVTPRYSYRAINEQLATEGISEKKIVLTGKLADLLAKKIYFDLDFIPHQENEIFVDAGAFKGETSISFLKWCKGNYRKILCFEPSIDTAEECRSLLPQSDKVTVISKGLWSQKTTLSFVEAGMESRITDCTEALKPIQIPVVDLDSVLKKKGGVTFIKMDIEGAEVEALRGAKSVIREFHPKLALSIYHRPEDIVEIPLLLYELNPNYRFMLRHYSLSWFDTVLYAVDMR